jgi:hypothetical protein
MFGEGLLSHERHKLLKGQQRLLQSFDGQPLDRLMLVPDDQFLLGSMHTHIHILTTERLLEIIGYIINEHAPMGADLTNEVRPIDMLQPRIRIYKAGDRW